MNHVVSDSQLLTEILKRKPLYGYNTDAQLKQRCWREVTDLLSPPDYTEVQKKELELLLRCRWSTMHSIISYYFIKFYDLVTDAVGVCDSNFETKVFIYKYLCTRVSNLIKVFMLDGTDFDDFQHYFDSRINDIKNGAPPPSTNRSGQNESVSKDSVATQTIVSQFDTPPERPPVVPHSEGNDDDDFFTNLRHELLTLPAEIKSQMKNEIMALVRQDQSKNTEQQNSSISFFKDLLKETVTFQSNLLNVQLDQLCEIKHFLDNPEPQPGSSSIVSRPRPPKVLYVKGLQISGENRTVPASVASSNDQNRPVSEISKDVDINGGSHVATPVNISNQLNMQTHNIDESNEFSDDLQIDVDMGDQPNSPPGDHQDGDLIINDIPSTSQEQSNFVTPSNNGSESNRPNTARKNPYIHRNEYGTEIHMCDEFILTLANSAVYRRTQFSAPSNIPSQGYEPNPTGPSSVDPNPTGSSSNEPNPTGPSSNEPNPTGPSSNEPTTSGLARNRKRSASETNNSSTQTLNQSGSPNGNITSSPNTSPNRDPNPRANEPGNRNIMRNIYMRSDEPSTSKDNYRL